MNSEKAILIILDGWGHGKDPKVSAIDQASTPYMDSLYESYPNSELITYGTEVGLPEGQMGNSEVGHLNLGAGRIVFQELARINNAIADGSFNTNPTLLKALDYAKENDRPIHLMGLVSDGGVHSHIEHLKTLCSILDESNITGYIHAFMDGRDTAPKNGIKYIDTITRHIAGSSVKMSSIIGRYYAMDRDKRWERTKLAYDLLVESKGKHSEDPILAIQEQYDNAITDEFLKPIKLLADNEGAIQEGDVVLFFNFRTDRPRQLTEVLTQSDLSEHGMKTIPLEYYTMTTYNENYNGLNVLYKKVKIENTLGEVIAANGLKQLRIAETEKYPHVTFFFSGGKELIVEDENRLLVKSPKVATYDLQPEMSALEVKEKVKVEIQNPSPDFICLNFANTDMVGHTGIMDAAIQATETVDTCLSEIIPFAIEHNYHIIIIADHGNADIMVNPDGSPHTAHTTNPVPCIYVHKNLQGKILKNGKLADIAPTILSLMKLEIPEEMTGNIILH